MFTVSQSVLLVFMCVTMCMECLWRPEEGRGAEETGVWHGYCDPNLGPLGVHLAAEPFL